MPALLPPICRLAALTACLAACSAPPAAQAPPLPAQAVFTRAQLEDKLKGGWAGQTIGVTFGGPTEFRYQGSMINDYQPIEWYDGYIRRTMETIPGLYDDLYMDLTFVEVFDRLGLDAPAAAHAQAYAEAGYMLWHANQAGRYNVLQGIQPPASGHWLQNPHADDIDFQIEADFSGIMSPGMPNTAAQIGDSIGHIMNYGDGWYGGVYVGAMYALAYVSDDIGQIVREALRTIPPQSTFHQCISDVIRWHAQYPDDWKRTWFEVQRKWSDDIGCPDGVFSAFNIDAKLNAAYIVLGLLYGEGDFTRTMEVATRAGQDSDCNPSSAGGILGVMLGYARIPAHWKQGLQDAEDIDFQYTSMSLNDTYAMSLRQALEVIARNGGTVDGDQIVIRVQQPAPVRLEQSFAGHRPVRKAWIGTALQGEYETEFEGIGFVLRGEARSAQGQPADDRTVLRGEVYLDGTLIETPDWPVSFTRRRHELAWKYQLPKGRHQLRIRLQSPPPSGYEVRLTDLLVYAPAE
ncbi:MAG: ADP-ribosylglycohydrolase family protein [Bacteroidia bacterium]|nr:ADP-ribosylglycohydrolase family protein [Bacteroidia bacterium]